MLAYACPACRLSVVAGDATSEILFVASGPAEQLEASETPYSRSVFKETPASLWHLLVLSARYSAL